MAEKRPIPVFDPACTKAVCDVLAQTDTPGLSTSEILSLLPQVKLAGLENGPNKRTALFHALHNAQVRRKRGDTLVVFLNAAMNPVRYVKNYDRFESLRTELNAALAFYGLKVNEQGKVAWGAVASTLSEAAQLAGELSTELRRRGCHD